MTRPHSILAAAFAPSIISLGSLPREQASTPCQSGCWPSSATPNQCQTLQPEDLDTRWDACLLGQCDAPSAKAGMSIRECVSSSCTDSTELHIQVIVKAACGTASTNVQVSSSQPQASTTPPEPITTDGVTSSRVPQATSGPSISAGSSDLSNTYPAIATGSVPSVASSTLSNQSGGWVTATTAPSGSGERNTTGAPIATPIISTFLTITDFTSELMATQTPPIGGIAASPPITTASIIPGSIPASTHLHPPAVRIVSAVVGSIVFIVALAILYMYVRRRISRGAIAPLAEKNVTGQPSEPILSTASSSQICQAVPDSASFDLLGNAPVSRATYADNHRPVSFEDRPLLRHSTASHSPSLLAGSIACSSMNEISESESYSLGHKIPIAEDLIHVNLPSSAAHGKSISSERRLRDTTISEESTMSEASSLGWHPSRMVRPSLAPRTRSVSYADGGVPQFGSNSTESHVSGSLISEEMGIAM